MTIANFRNHSQLAFDFTYSFPLELEPIEEAILTLLHDIDLTCFEHERNRGQKGRPLAVDTYTMLVILIYGRTRSCLSCRELARLCKRDLFLLAILDGAPAPSYVTINRFIKAHPASIEYVLQQTVCRLEQMGELNKTVLFQDGTKVESRAGRYTFIWKGSIEKYLVHLQEKTRTLVSQVNAHYGWDLPTTAKEMQEVLKQLVELLEGRGEELIPSKRGIGHRLTPIQRFYRTVTAYLEKYAEYDQYLTTIGATRNSMSRSDPEATFMRMKDDYMRNGQLKPAYNIQNIVDSGYVIACHTSSDRNDMYLLEPALEKVKTAYPWQYSGVCADSGYDSLYNRKLLEQEHMTDYITPRDWYYSQSKAGQTDVGHRRNMTYNSTGDVYICKAGHKLVPTGTKTYKNKRGPDSIMVVYSCLRGCVSCKHRKQCIGRSKRKYKQFLVHKELLEYQKKAVKNISDSFGVAARVNRSIQVEGAFAQIKHNLSFTRFLSFGAERVTTEWTLMCLAMNAIRLSYRSEANLIGVPYWYTPPPTTVA